MHFDACADRFCHGGTGSLEEAILDRYNSPAGAADYRGKFERRWTERINNVREQNLVRTLLAGIPREDIRGLSLDLPSGYGRLNPLLSKVSPRVVEGDWSFYLLQEARSYLADLRGRQPIGFVRGTALTLPFRDRAFDLVMSVRLCHHISEHAERMQYVREILRISGKWVVITYFDTASIKNRINAFKVGFTGKRGKWTLSRADVAGVATESGYDIVRTEALSRLFSGHNYAVLRRNP